MIWNYKYAKLKGMDWRHQPMLRKFTKIHNDGLKFGLNVDTNPEYKEFYTQYTHYETWMTTYRRVCGQELTPLLMGEGLEKVFEEVQGLLLNKPVIRIEMRDQIQNLTQIGLWVQWKLKIDTIFAQIKTGTCDISAS